MKLYTKVMANRANQVAVFVIFILLSTILNVSCIPGDDIMKADVSAPGPPLKIVCSLLPEYILTSNIAVTRKNISLEMIVPPHFTLEPQKYSLTSEDKRRFAAANMLIINGFGIDAHIEEAARKAKSDMKVIDSSEGITAINSKTGVNPFIWMSPSCAIIQVKNIEKALIEIDPQGEQEIKKKADEYVKILEKLKQDFGHPGDQDDKEKVNRLGNNTTNEKEPLVIKVIAEGEYFDYLARDYGLKILDTVATEKECSEARIRELSQKLKEIDAKVIILKSSGNYSKENEISKGMPVCFLDVLMQGSTYPDSYHKTMTKNMSILQRKLDTTK